MSIIEPVFKLAVDVKSALDDALTKIPNNPMEPEELTNAVKNRSVQKLEMDQSYYRVGLKAVSDEGDNTKVTSGQVQSWLRDNREDTYGKIVIEGRPSIQRSGDPDRIASLARIDRDMENDFLFAIGDTDIPDEFNAENVQEALTGLEQQYDNLSRPGASQDDRYELNDIENNMMLMRSALSRLGRQTPAGQESQRLAQNEFSNFLESIDMDRNIEFNEPNLDAVIQEARGRDLSDETADLLETREAMRQGEVAGGFEAMRPEELATANLTARADLDAADQRETFAAIVQENSLLGEDNVDVAMNAHNINIASQELDLKVGAAEEAGDHRYASFLASQRDELDRLYDTVVRQEVDAVNNPLEMFRELAETVGDDASNLTLADLPRYIETLEEGIDSGRISIGDDIPPDFLFDLRSIVVPDVPAGQTTYTFPSQAYRSYSLPDTDDASYAVNIYTNPAVDRKGYKYGRAHFSNSEGADTGVFHTRTDSPEPGVHRIQEIQSDIQNEMTKERNYVVQRWQGGNAELYNNIRQQDVRHLDSTSSALPEVKAIRKEVNAEIIQEVKEISGLDISVRIGIPLETTPLKAIQDILGELAAQHTRDLDGMSQQQLQKLTQYWMNLDRAYGGKVNMAKNIAQSEDAQKAMLRVTPEKRTQRIIEGNTAIPEESQLIKEATQAGADAIEAKYDYLVDLGPISTVKSMSRRVLESVLDMDIGDMYAQVKRQNPHLSVQAFDQLVDEMDPKFLNDYFGVDAEQYEQFLDMRNLGQNEAIQYIRKNQSTLPPLEKFPDQGKYQLPVDWRKQGIQEEMVKAVNNGQKEVWLTVNPTGTNSLVRGGGPQKAYDPGGNINKTFRSVAKRFDARIVEEDGYLKAVFPTNASSTKKYVVGAAGAATLSLPAYAEPANQDFRVDAFEQGYTPGQVDAYLAENPLEEQSQPMWAEQARNQGYTEEQITQYQYEQWVKELDPGSFAEPQPEALVESDVPTVSGDPVYSKMDDQEVMDLAVELGVNPTTPSGIDAIYAESLKRSSPSDYDASFGKPEDEIKQDMADYIELYDVDSPFLWMRSKLGFADAVAKYDAIQQDAAANVISLGKEKGYELVKGDGLLVDEGGNGLAADEWFVLDGQGQYHNVTPDFMNTMAHYFGETSGAVAGAAIGVGVAVKFGTATDPLLTAYPGGRMFSTLAKFGIVSAYSAAGAVLGDEVDYVSAAVRQDEGVTWGMAGEKALGAMAMGVVGDVAAVPVIALGRLATRQVMHAFREIRNGNIEGAYRMLKDTTGLTDAQIQEIVNRWKKLNTPEAVDQPLELTVQKRFMGKDFGGTKVLTPEEEALAIVPVTKAGGEKIVATAGHIDPRASVVTAREVSKRADDLLEQSAKRVKAADALTDDDLVISVQKNLNEYIENEKVFYDQTRNAGNDLVVEANPGYGFNLNTVGIKPLFDSVTSTIGRKGRAEQALYTLERANALIKSGTFDDLIDLRQLMNDFRSGNKMKKRDILAFKEVMGSIDNEIDRVMAVTPGGDDWMKQWDQARSSYGIMKDVTNSVLAKAIFKKGTNPQKLAKAFVDYGIASDDTYTALMHQLDSKSWRKIETNIVDYITNKHTVGLEGEFRATQFPELNKELSQYNFLTKEGNEMQEAARLLSEVYTNDVSLSYISGGIKLTPPQQGLTANLAAKAKYSTAAKLWTYLTRFIGTPGADTASMARKVAEFLDDPLDAATVDKALEVASKDRALKESMLEVQTQTAAQRAKGQGTTKIKIYKNRSGQTFTTPTAGAKEVKDGAIPMHRVTSGEVLLEKIGIDPLNLSKSDKGLLRNRGYKAIALEDGSLIML